jgi:hypothetical protein
LTRKAIECKLANQNTRVAIKTTGWYTSDSHLHLKLVLAIQPILRSLLLIL